MKARILVACPGIALVLTPAFAKTEQERVADPSNVEEYRTDAGPWPSAREGAWTSISYCDHPDALGGSFVRKGHARGAEEHVQRGLGILQAHLGKDHSDTAAAMCQLGSILLDRGELTQAFGLLRMAAAAHNKLEAFDYAGTRAPLISHWPVYSDAAVQLLNMTFAELRRNPTLGRSEALRRAMVDLMDDPGQEDSPHRSIWAPFSLTGEGAQ
ncbi:MULTISPECIES: CHAT domain-containing protein [Rhizobium]|uniref:CHAT domain-containing protein n=1 Tax=Rhizobium sophoriradicis TaxID=1535245 RepID=A0A2A5KN48_9HYPH|nr:hypothetical protein CPT34_24690 [Rhizobium sophoriradicis]